MKSVKANLIDWAAMGTDLSADAYCDAILVEGSSSASISLNWTGTFNGSFKIKVSNDPGLSPTYGHDINSSVINVANGLYLGQAGYTYSIPDLTYRWIQVYYTFVSGTGTLTTCDMILKG